MEKKTENIITIIIYISVIFTFVFSIFFNTNNKVILGLISSVLLVTVSFRHVIIYNSVRYQGIAKFLILIDLALVYWIVLIDRTGVSQLYLLALICEAVIYNPAAYSAFAALASFITFTASIYVRNSYTTIFEFIPFALGSLASFLFVYGLMYITKYQINQRSKLLSAVNEIEIKNKQLEKAYDRLMENSEVIEEVTALKERNRIAREIHDTVGHTLTTVLVEIEAGKRLISKDASKAAEKLELAQEQVRKGLNDIRQSVKMLQSRGSIMDFIPSIESLIQETEKHTDIKIKHNISFEVKIPHELEKLIYNALLEGITNGIKHGSCTEFDFSLTSANDTINFSLSDNGRGSDNIIAGFGLTSMKNKIQDYGGYIDIQTSKGRGCSLKFSIPVKNSQ